MILHIWHLAPGIKAVMVLSLAKVAGIMILEELNHALDRNAPIYGWLSGYGLSCDAYHIASPDESGHGAKRCMDMALRGAQLMPSDIGYINGHSTSTPVGDKAELRAIESLFSAGMPVSSTNGATGHLLGAAGSIEAIFALLAVQSGVLPPTLNMTDAEGNMLGPYCSFRPLCARTFSMC